MIQNQWVIPLAYSSLICSYSWPDKYMTSTKTFLRSYSKVPSTSYPRTRLEIFSCSYLFSNNFLESSTSSPVLTFTSMIFSSPFPESMRKLQSFLSFLHISLAQPTLMVNSQSLSFFALIRVSFNFTSCFHCRSAALVLLYLNYPKLLLVLARECVVLLPYLRLVCSYCSLLCLERKLEIVLSTLRQVQTFFSNASKFTNYTPSFSSKSSSLFDMMKPTRSVRSKNYYKVRQSLLVFQKTSKSMFFWTTKQSKR